ncbi:hypothetical protein [Humidesulfovibrio idahonensis]
MGMVEDETFRRVVKQLDKNDMKLAEAIDRQGRVLMEIQQAQFAELQKKALKELSDNFTKNVAHLYDSASKYSNMVTLAGYAAFFTIWNGTKTHVESEIIFLFSVLLVGISAAIFVFFEVYKMQKVSSQTKYYQEIISAIVEMYKKGEYAQGLSKFEEAKVAEAQFTLSFARLGRICLYSSVLTGLAGAGALMAVIASGVVKQLYLLLLF